MFFIDTAIILTELVFAIVILLPIVRTIIWIVLGDPTPDAIHVMPVPDMTAPTAASYQPALNQPHSPLDRPSIESTPAVAARMGDELPEQLVSSQQAVNGSLGHSHDVMN